VWSGALATAIRLRTKYTFPANSNQYRFNNEFISNQKLLTLHSIASFDLQLSVAPPPHGEQALLAVPKRVIAEKGTYPPDSPGAERTHLPYGPRASAAPSRPSKAPAASSRPRPQSAGCAFEHPPTSRHVIVCNACPAFEQATPFWGWGCLAWPLARGARGRRAAAAGLIPRSAP
jgi:hypothetical protein